MFTWEMLIFLLNVPSRVPGYLFIVLHLHQTPVVNLPLDQRMSRDLRNLVESSGETWKSLDLEEMCECRTARLMLPIFLCFRKHCQVASKKEERSFP